MGYIAPIQFDQYIQYANRSVGTKYHYAKLSRVEGTAFHKKFAQQGKQSFAKHLADQMKNKEKGQYINMYM